MSEPVSILFVGDVVGGIGSATLLALLPVLRERHRARLRRRQRRERRRRRRDHAEDRRELFAAGVDVITLGNHTYRHREVYAYLDEEERILRPANFLRSQPGHGSCVVSSEAACGSA